MIKNDRVYGVPLVQYKDTKANITALSGVGEGAIAYATDTNEFGSYDGATWTWGQGGSFDLAATIHAATEETSLHADDEVGIWEHVSGLLRKVKFSTWVTDLGAYFVSHSSSTASNDFLVGSGSGAWIKKTLAQTITILRTSLDSVYAALSHTHAASDIASGTLAAARLPAPTTSALGGVQRNTGSAGQFVNGIDSSGALTYDTPAGGGSADGWTAISATGTSATLDSPSFEISFNADMTAILGLGDRIKITQSTTKYFIVTKVGAFSAGATIITCYGGTDYTLVASGTTAISNPYYSHMKAPFGFPTSKDKWTVRVTDSTARTQSSPTANTYYNPNSTKIDVPIGSWELSISCVGGASKASNNLDLNVALSTSTSSVSSEFLHRYNAGYSVFYLNFYLSTSVVVTSKTSYYLIMATGTSSVTLMEIYNPGGNMEIRATCTYL